MKLTGKQNAFIGEYLIDFNATRAAEAAGYSKASARLIGSENLTKPYIAAEIARRTAIIANKIGLLVEDVIRDITRVLRADPRNLVEYRRAACRYCYGAGFLYQYTPQEFRDAYVLHMKSDGYLKHCLPFAPQGGDGYNPKRDPRPDCPECFGEGVGQLFLHDTRTLPPDAAVLYAGVKETNAGVEVLMRSKEKAIEHAARYLGMNRESLQLTNTTPSGLNHFYTKPETYVVLDDIPKGKT
jgi:phage terminase small subunit